MKKWLLFAALLIAGFQLIQPQTASQSDSADQTREAQTRDRRTASQANASRSAGVDQLSRAFSERLTNIQVSGDGVVLRVFADDTNGSRHQRFLLRLPSSQTVLIAHNIDLAPRVDNLRTGESVSFSGEYEWNERGGVVHWTHRDPKGRHTSGWLKRDGRTYQ